jgi:uncharacterized protein YndB with AHSA1/START domain
MAIRESVSGRVDAAPADVFGFLTDIAKLPDWNHAITEVVDAPAQLVPGAEWKVRLHALGQTWVSKSRVSELDPATLRFSYRSQSDDGNPSYADWVWQVEPDRDGCTVSVSVALNPVTFWRKNLLVKIRRPSLRNEMHQSLRELGTATQTK